ncbi:MAG: RNA polymerase factor sigma-54 [Candidatus Poribacteria bacterium]|nr:RNA polymerase factor sigma-54 [Candidatus Poribacteria bacterium]
MNLVLKQTMSLQQRLIMTPKLQQAIQVLLMSRLDLTQHLSQQLEQNPFLDEDQEEAEIEELNATEELDPDTQWNEPEEIVDREDKEPDIDWENCFDDMISISEKAAFEHWDNDDRPQADLSHPQSLQDFLLEQLTVTPFSEMQRQIGERIIGNLDDNGQLKVSPLFRIDLKFQGELNDGKLSEDLCKKIEKGLRLELQNDKISLSQDVTITVKDEDSRWQITDENGERICTVKKVGDKLSIYEITLEEIADEVGYAVDEVEEVLRFIQNNFDPIGIAYQTIPETLLIQMKAVGIDDPLVEKIISGYWEDLYNNHLPRIAQELEVEIDDIERARQLIGTLDPYPGRHFSDPTDPRRPPSIIPDVTIEKVDGEYQFITNEDGMPLLRLNPTYVDWMSNGHKDLDSKARGWLENRRSQAIDLLKSIAQRRGTIAKVTEAIFDVQADFLEQGVKGLKPLVLKQIADMVGVHESTVSRVTSNKYVETPQGIYRLKYFFSGELPTDSGSNVAATTVKETIKEMIDKEDPAKPLSDRAISDILKTQGIHAARRTVAKYREELGVLPSSKRKRKW